VVYHFSNRSSHKLCQPLLPKSVWIIFKQYKNISSVFCNSEGVIWMSCVYLNFSFHHLSSPDGWSCQTAQTIHHLEATLSNVQPCLFSSFNTPFSPLCIILSFSPLSSQICQTRSIFLLLISIFSFFIVPL